MPLPIHILARHRARPDAVDCDDPTDFTFVETFSSEEALKEHAAAPYIAGLAAKLEGFVVRPAEVSRYHAIAADPGRSGS